MHIGAPWTPRRPARHPIQLACQVVRERDFQLVACWTLDVSEVGMLARPIARVLTGESVIVSFMAPFTRTWIDTEGTVVRVVHGRRASDFGMALGIWFHDLDAVSRALLRRNLADVPRRAPMPRVNRSAPRILGR